MPREKVYIRIANELQAQIHGGSRTHLPSITALAVEWKVTYLTMWRAIRELARRGVVVVSSGKQVRITGSSTNPDPVGQGETVYQKLRTGIASGEYQVGTPLPKTAYLVASQGISALTLARVFARLQHDGMVHRVKRRWLAGPAHPNHPAKSTGVPTEPPVVLLLLGAESEWTELTGNPHTAPFFWALSQEAMKCGLRLELVLHEKNPDNPSPLPRGADEIRARIARLGSRYLGALVALPPRMQDVTAEWIREFSLHNKPVVHFDHTDENEGVIDPHHYSRSPLFRLHLDESRAAECAVRALVDAGHSRIAIPLYEHAPSFWMRRRTENAVRFVRQYAPQAKAVVANQNEPFWNFDDWRGLNDFTKGIRRNMRSHLSAQKSADKRDAHLSLAAWLETSTPSLAGPLRSEGVTAFVALNDRMAREYYAWFYVTGRAVPRDISIVSFDNSWESVVFPISTVDFGFSRLGYLAAHIFWGDIPVRADRLGNIPGICTLVDRGSVARCRN